MKSLIFIFLSLGLISTLYSQENTKILRVKSGYAVNNKGADDGIKEGDKSKVFTPDKEYEYVEIKIFKYERSVSAVKLLKSTSGYALNVGDSIMLSDDKIVDELPYKTQKLLHKLPKIPRRGLGDTMSIKKRSGSQNAHEENAVVTIGLYTVAGSALTIFIVALTSELFSYEIKHDLLKWSYVGGTLGGFLFGVYEASSKPLVPYDPGGPTSKFGTLAKTFLMGSMTGLEVAIAAQLLIDDNLLSRSSTIVPELCWAVGTVAGLLVGIYHISSQPGKGSALLEIESNGIVRKSLPSPEVRFHRDLYGDLSLEYRVNLLSLSF